MNFLTIVCNSCSKENAGIKFDDWFRQATPDNMPLGAYIFSCGYCQDEIITIHVRNQHLSTKLIFLPGEDN